MPIDPVSIALALAGIVIGGVLKGATGAGSPVVAVPMLAMAFDVPTAVTIFTIPNLLSNIWQGWSYRRHLLPWRFAGIYAAAGLAGAGVGTVLLISLSASLLEATVAVAVLAYIGFRLLRPDWVLPFGTAVRLAAPVGLAAGMLQGAVGVSAPISITFLNAMKIERPAFIATISLLFLAMTLIQIPIMLGAGLMTPQRIGLGLGVTALLLASMPLGAALGRRIPGETFDRLIMVLLALVALKLLAQSF